MKLKLENLPRPTTTPGAADKRPAAVRRNGDAPGGSTVLFNDATNNRAFYRALVGP